MYGVNNARRKKTRLTQQINTASSYLDTRKVQLVRNTWLEITSGVPQGSILRPTPWNILYGGVLRTSLPEGVNTIAYTDDLVLVWYS